jgi:hypothetical protein
VQKSFSDMSGRVSEDLQAIGTSFEPVLENIAGTVRQTFDKLTPVLSAAASAIAGPFQAFSDALITAFGQPAVQQAITDVAKAFGDILTAVTPGLARGVGQIASGISKIASSVSANPKAFADFIGFLFATAGGALTAIAWLTRVASYIEQHFVPAFKRARHDVAHWWDVMFSALIGSQIRFAHNVEHAWDTLMTDIKLGFDIAKNEIGITWDRIELIFLSGVKFIVDTMGKLPGPLGAPFRAAAKDIGGSMAAIRQDVKNRTTQIQADIDKIHGKTITLEMIASGHGGVKVTSNQVGVAAKLIALQKQGFAGGGLVRYGSGQVSDDVPAMLSRGEVVVPANMVARGAVAHLAGLLPGLARGGVAGAAMPGAVSRALAADGSAALASTGSAVIAAMIRAIRAAQPNPFAGITGVPSGGKISGSAAAAMAFAKSILWAYGWGQDQFPPLRALWMGESGWRWNALNPSSGAYGIPQALPASKMASAGADWRTNPATQVRWGLGYVKNTPGYGSPSIVYSKWLARSPHWYAQGGLVPGMASGGLVGQQGSAWLKAWQTRHGGGFGAAWGPVVLNEQIPRMQAAIGRATTLSHAGGLSAGQHRFWANAAADEKRRLAVLKRELTTERSWRGQLVSDEVLLAREIGAAGNLPSLAGPVKGWKAQLGRDKATVAAISKMLGYSNAYIKAHPPAPSPGVLAAHSYGGDVPVTDAIGAYLHSVMPFARGGRIPAASYDRGGWLPEGMSLAFNSTGAPERVGGQNITVTLQVQGSGSGIVDRAIIDMLRRHVRVSGAGSVQRSFSTPGTVSGGSLYRTT